MKLAFEANAWGGVIGTPSSVTDIPTGYYRTAGDIEVAVAAIAAAGFEGIEFFDGNLLDFESDIGRFRDSLDQHGLELAGVYSGGHFIYRDAHDDELARFERSIAVAAAAGARHYILGGGSVRSGGRRVDDYAVMADLLDRVADRARMAGLLPSYHPHLGSLAQSDEQIDALLEQSSIGLCADVAHLAAAGADPADVIRRYADRLTYVHLKDADLDAGGFLPLGDGDVDLDAVIDAVRAAGYRDWITVELDGYVGDLADAAARSHTFLAERGLAN